VIATVLTDQMKWPKMLEIPKIVNLRYSQDIVCGSNKTLEKFPSFRRIAQEKGQSITSAGLDFIPRVVYVHKKSTAKKVHLHCSTFALLN